ncbi:MAG: histidine phosphatase family protein [Candidatus Staskawiczbacteria bacterium]|nr:histidine phosphatase family protein [Candidatus Staskawiczbacteria bacterium]
MAKLFLLRHLKSQWNEDNRFAGWTDGPLSKKATAGALSLANEIFKDKIDIAYTSPLFRNQDTVARIFEAVESKYPFFIHLDAGKMQKWGNYIDISENDVPTYVSENLNERYYGELQGLNKEETIKKYGEEKVHLWRRSYDIAPPGGESEKDVYKRTAPFYKKYVEKDLKRGKNVLVVASHNSLRAIVKYIEKIPDEKIIDLELPFGSLTKYEFTDGVYKRLQ